MNRHCKQQLQKFGLTQADITHVCIAPTLYPLLQYLLLVDDNIAFQHTFYFVNEVIPENARCKLPCKCYNYFGKSITQKWNRRLQKLRMRFFRYIDFPFLKSAEIFAYDLPPGGLLVGNRPYILLPDAPNCLTLNAQYTSAAYIRMQEHANTLFGRIQKIIFGDIFVHYLGYNSQCKAIFMTEENIAPVLEGKEFRINSLESMWACASPQKKDFILNLFDVTRKDILILNSRPNLFFSQPLLKDCGLMDIEYANILTQLFSNYPPDSIIIKTHPRDQFDYAKYFPNIIVFSKPISSQLLNFMGVKPQKIITISSTAIEGFPESIECDYYGNKVHPKIEHCLGKDFKPIRIVNFK